MTVTPLRVVEHYVSTQGEGPCVGYLTQFVRFAGCNLKCPTWPCDSQFAIDPKQYREEQKTLWPKEVVAQIKHLRSLTGATNVCFTGGEPFLQSHDALLEVIRTMGGEEVNWEAFTNGTFEIPETFFQAGLEPVMDWKLPGSGEKTFVVQRSRNLRRMTNYMQGAVKFTIANEQDFNVALEVWESIVQDSNVPVFAGPVWDGAAGGGWSPTDVVDLIKKHKVPWRLNVQVHNFIYGAQTRGT
jgi:7-carboxy-7-deazaguanine synthase